MHCVENNCGNFLCSEQNHVSVLVLYLLEKLSFIFYLQNKNLVFLLFFLNCTNWKQKWVQISQKKSLTLFVENIYL